jgi:hypothetical protein
VRGLRVTGTPSSRTVVRAGGSPTHGKDHALFPGNKRATVSQQFCGAAAFAPLPPEAALPCKPEQSRGQWTWAPNCTPVPEGM